MLLKLSSQGIRSPYSDDELYIVISMFVFSFFVCFFTLRMRKHTSGDCRLSELVLSDSDYTTARYLSPDSKIVSLCVEQTGEVKRLTVAGSRWEEERGSSEEKEERRGEEREGIWEWPLLPYTWEPDVPQISQASHFRHAPTPRGPRNPKLFPPYSQKVSWAVKPAGSSLFSIRTDDPLMCKFKGNLEHATEKRVGVNVWEGVDDKAATAERSFSYPHSGVRRLKL